MHPRLPPQPPPSGLRWGFPTRSLAGMRVRQPGAYYVCACVRVSLSAQGVLSLPLPFLGLLPSLSRGEPCVR